MEDLVPWTEGLQELLVRALIALGLGFLVGLEREYARVVDREEQFAGVRTYALVALFGFLAAFLAERYGPLLFTAALVLYAALVITSYALTARSGSYGITTELSSVLTFLVGAVVFQGYVLLATILTVAITLLLSFKLPLHRFIATLTPKEIRAFVQFVIISAVVLPVLPAGPFGPGGVWDLRDIWTMVVLVSGISLAGYLLAKILGTERGTLLTGLVGGLVSSTAVTLGLSRRTRGQAGVKRAVEAVAIVAASAVLYPRILLETWAVNRPLAGRLALPVLAIAAVAIGAALFLHRRDGGKDGVAEKMALSNPLNFGVALQFAAIYMAVQWLMALADQRFSTEGLYGASLVFGATDMDAITLSLARRSTAPDAYRTGVTAILLATLSNTVMKYAIVLFFGDRTLRRYVGVGFGAIAVATLVALGVLHLTPA